MVCLGWQEVIYEDLKVGKFSIEIGVEVGLRSWRVGSQVILIGIWFRKAGLGKKIGSMSCTSCKIKIRVRFNLSHNNNSS